MRANEGLALALLGLLVASSARAETVRDPIHLPVHSYFQPWSCCGGSPAPVFQTAFRDAAVASDGTGFLVVWSEPGAQGIEGPDGEPAVTLSPAVYGLRIGPAGALLDASPIEIARDEDAPSFLQVAYAQASDTYLVAWRSGDGDEEFPAVSAARVASDGFVLDAAAMRLPAYAVPSAELGFARPVVASPGDGWLVFYGDGVVTVSADGAISEQRALGFTPRSVAFDGNRFLGVWADTSVPGAHVVRGALLERDGAPVDGSGFSIPSRGVDSAAIAFDGTSYVVAWMDFVTVLEGVAGVRVSREGEVLDAFPLPLIEGSAWLPAGNVQIAFDGMNEVVAWNGSMLAEYGYIRGAALYGFGELFVPGEPFTLSSPALLPPAIAANEIGSSMIVCEGRVFRGGLYPDYFLPTATLVTTWAALSVSRVGTGRGTVSSLPDGVFCGDTCLAAFDAPTQVLLTAAPAPGSAFAGWSGACDGTAPTCTVSVASATSVEARFVDVAAPVVTVPPHVSAAATTRRGAVVDFAAAARDDVLGDVPPACSPAPGSLFPPGTTAVTCTAADAEGNVASASFDVTVTFAWAGVLPPVDPDGRSLFAPGRTVPVKFALSGASAGIADLEARLYLVKISGGMTGAEEAATSTAAATAGNAFRYDPRAGHYAFNLATGGLAPGVYALVIDLGDGVRREVRVSIRA